MKQVIVSGYFNPLHKGHLAYLREAKKLGDRLTVIVNSDVQVKLKGSVPFMDEKERLEIIEAIKWVDCALISIDNDGSQCETLEFLRKKYECDEIIFANGGDRTKENIPEMRVKSVTFVFGVGGTEKLQSSSGLLKNMK